MLRFLAPDYKAKCKPIDYFHRDSAGIELEGLGKSRVSLESLVERAKEGIKKCGLTIVPRDESRVTIVAFTQYPDHEGYNIYGVLFFIGKKNINFSITYYGVCGDLNTVDVTKGEHVMFYCK